MFLCYQKSICTNLKVGILTHTDSTEYFLCLFKMLFIKLPFFMHTCMSECNNLYQIKFELSKIIDLLKKQ